ncbi:hypothetical protein FACS1894179_04880 [Bacteroidia bacterium]|nr:hypothetical protein FACS1894179_04880 [Bacteroidia bacterium]
MGLYNFKDKYTNLSNNDISTQYPVRFFSTVSPSGDGSRGKPYSTRQALQLGVNNALIISAGVVGNTFYAPGGSGYYTHNTFILGSGIRNTVFKDCTIPRQGNNTNDPIFIFKDLKIESLSINYANLVATLYKCDIKDLTPISFKSSTVYNCIIRTNSYSGINNSYVGVTGKTIPNANLNLFDACDVVLTASDINSYKNNYLAFNNCKLRIGGETDYAALTGTTEAELRADFVARCAAQSITVSDITDMGETLKQGRWVFSNDSCIDGLVIKDSVIHNFEKRRLIYFGYSDWRSDKITITTDKSKPAAFSPDYANSSVAITNDSIALAANTDISNAVKGQADTNIMWLGGKHQLNKLDIIHNFPKMYGVFMDSSPSLSSIPVNKNGEIIPYENGVQRTYMVRSNDDTEATITYNGVTYSSGISTRNNIFRGVDNVTSFTTVTANAVVYEILDEVMHQTIQMRIVNKIPGGNITAGTALASGYWYLVEHDTDQSNTTDYVTYAGTDYPVGSSFIASGTDTFTKSGNVHLRRCWNDAFDYDTETLDKSFWTNEQKPKWFDVLPDDLRCLMKNNNGSELEMQTDADGNYIASGHADFYHSVLGDSGVVKPSYNINGTYMQLRLVITTVNPM